MGKGATTRRYSDEFKQDAVGLYQSSGRSIRQVARELGISESALSSWVRQWEKTSSSEAVAIAKEEAILRKRVRELEEEIEILKRFTKYWVKDTGR